MPSDNNNQENVKPKKKKRWLLIIIFIIPLLLISSAFAYYFVRSSSSADEEKNEQSYELKDLKKLKINSFTVNLADTGYRRYLRTTITIEFVSKKVEEELQIKLHRVKDIFLDILRNKRVSDIDTAEKTNNLKKELVNALNSELIEGEIIGLYFEEFIIQ
jgi:flagellar FliL protein